MQKQKNLILIWPALAVLVALGWAAESDKVNVSFGFNEAKAGDREERIEIIEAQILRGDAVRQVVKLDRGREFELIQVFPAANKEHVCLVALDPKSRTQRVSVDEIECFPIKMNPTPTMY